MNPLIDSNIFRYRINFEEWPNSHLDNTTLLNAYNGSIFDLRHRYTEIFPELEEERQQCKVDINDPSVKPLKEGPDTQKDSDK